MNEDRRKFLGLAGLAGLSLALMLAPSAPAFADDDKDGGSDDHGGGSGDNDGGADNHDGDDNGHDGNDANDDSNRNDADGNVDDGATATPDTDSPDALVLKRIKTNFTTVQP